MFVKVTAINADKEEFKVYLNLDKIDFMIEAENLVQVNGQVFKLTDKATEHIANFTRKVIGT